MNAWHCGTAHCRAGWVVTLAGDAGIALEARIGTAAAALAIYLASDPSRWLREQLPNFYSSDVDALKDMKRMAEEPTPPPPTGTRAMSNEEMTQRQLEAVQDARNAYPAHCRAGWVATQAPQNFWQQDGPSTPAPIQPPPPPLTLWARFMRWIRT